MLRRCFLTQWSAFRQASTTSAMLKENIPSNSGGGSNSMSFVIGSPRRALLYLPAHDIRKVRYHFAILIKKKMISLIYPLHKKMYLVAAFPSEMFYFTVYFPALKLHRQPCTLPNKMHFFNSFYLYAYFSEEGKVYIQVNIVISAIVGSKGIEFRCRLCLFGFRRCSCHEPKRRCKEKPNSCAAIN